MISYPVFNQYFQTDLYIACASKVLLHTEENAGCPMKHDTESDNVNVSLKNSNKMHILSRQAPKKQAHKNIEKTAKSS
jgi:hypothetical protein